MIRDELRALWAEPRVPDPPVRVWRDWLLLAACLVDTALEGALRPDIAWRPVAVVLAVGVSFVTLWRRTHPLATIAVTFGSTIALTVAGRLLGQPEPVGLYTVAVVPVLVYALTRWASGRDIVLGLAILLAAFAVSVVADDVPVGDQVGGFVFLMFPAVVGVSVRFLATSRLQELERMRSHERVQLARELHDTVAHHVSAIVIRAQAGRVVAGADPAAAVQALEGIEEEGARTLEAMRTMVGALRDANVGPELAPLGGVADLERLVGNAGGQPRIDLLLDVAPGELAPAVDAAVYRIVQESLTNAVRHAVDPTEVVVRVVREPDDDRRGIVDGIVRVTVRDDGAATGRAPHRDGYGLAGLRERAAMLGGRLEAGPCPGRGWLVEAELPRRKVGARDHSRSRR